MDSPVVVDTASKFGRNLDLGFPFDDEGFGRRSDIRSHLDDLAARHPEFADHLLGSAWGDIPFNGSLRNRRRGSGSNNSHQPSSHQDEDARSQASGSSAASAASGASGVSSHGEPDQSYHHPPESSSSSVNQKLPQYGLRNTVDIGQQHRHNIMNQDRDNRGQRSMSAPPENRQGADEVTNQNYSQQSQNPRFVSRVDITTNPTTGEKIPQPTNQGQKSQPQQQQQSNVRHIPIFVEGRDTPVIPKNIDEPIYRQPSPPRFRDSQFDVPPEFHSPPQFQRPSHFNQHFGGKHNPWPSFQDGFSRDTFDHPGIRRTNPQQPTHPSSTFRQNQFPHNQSSNVNFNNNNSSNNNFNNQQETPKQRQQFDKDHQSDNSPPEPTKRKQIVPKDALEKVSLVQQEVDSLNEQVKLWNGSTRKDKEYIYLDEMLTRELIKLDDIDTEGKENVRQARKNAIKSIQDSISLLESKAPLGEQQGDGKIEQQQQQQPMEVQISNTEVEKVQDNVENMEIEKKADNEEVVSKAIPLPPPEPTSANISSSMVDNLEKANDNAGQGNGADNCTAIVEGRQETTKNEDNQMIVDANVAIPLEAPPTLQVSSMDIQSTPEINDNIENKNVNEIKNVNDSVKDNKKTAKKVKKAKKQTPVSTEPIPLPAPETHQT